MNCPHHACSTGPCSQDFLRIACIREPGTTSLFLQEVPSSAIPEGELCSLDRNSRVLLSVLEVSLRYLIGELQRSEICALISACRIMPRTLLKLQARSAMSVLGRSTNRRG